MAKTAALATPSNSPIHYYNMDLREIARPRSGGVIAAADAVDCQEVVIAAAKAKGNVGPNGPHEREDVSAGGN